MGEAVQLQGATLAAGPTVVSDGSQFPSGSTTIPFALNPAQKPYVVETGRVLPTVNTANAYQIMQGIGTGGPVTQAHTLYVRVAAPMKIRITQNGVTNVVLLNGVLLLEFDPSNPMTLLEINGSGQVEYAAWGNQ